MFYDADHRSLVAQDLILETELDLLFIEQIAVTLVVAILQLVLLLLQRIDLAQSSELEQVFGNLSCDLLEVKMGEIQFEGHA